MSSSSLSIAQVLTLLRENPRRIATLTQGQRPARLQIASGKNEWSVNDILAHLRACSDVWGRCIAETLARDKPTLRHISPRTWMKKTDYLAQKFEPSFRAYTAQRAGLLQVLEALPPKDWLRTAVVTGMSKPRERSVLSYAGGLALHERGHVEQIEEIINTK